VHLTGFLAWLAWGFIHIYFLIGFRNRIRVMADWVWQYLTFRRGTRLITGESEWIVPPPGAHSSTKAAVPGPHAQ
jgi:hypothetical protein